jgi:uncharacterized membrane protein
MMMVRATDCQELDMSVDEALTYVISMGVIVPGENKKLLARKALAAQQASGNTAA